MPATPSRLDGDGGVVTRLGAQRFQLLAGAFAEEDVPFAQRPAGTDIRILGQLERRIGLKRLEDQSAVVQGFVVHPFQSFEWRQHLISSVEGLEPHPVRIS